MTPLITNDAIVFGILSLVLAVIFKTSALPSKFWQVFYKYIPPLLLCYFIPSLLNSFGVISAEVSKVDEVARDFLLPASLILFTVSIDLKTIRRLGNKALILFFAGSLGIVLGGPVALFIGMMISPEIQSGAGEHELWRGLAALAGSWIGGSANQAAMKTVFEPDDQLFSAMIAIDVFFSNMQMALSLYLIQHSKKIDAFFKADASDIEQVRNRIESYQAGIARIPTLHDMVMLVAIGLGGTGIAHALAEGIVAILKNYEAALQALYLESFISVFLWIVLTATTLGLGLSFTKARELEGVGASRVASLFLYLLVATIGMKMDVFAILQNPVYFLIGLIWLLFHLSLLLITARLTRSPFFFVAVSSQANIGGVASSTIVASGFHPALASVGVLLAVLGYAIGTYGGLICAVLMRWVFVNR